MPPLLDEARLPRARPPRPRRRWPAGSRRRLRERKSGGGREGLVQGLLQEYSLSSQEGVALMCLAEALLRIPDPATRDALIRDKISTGQWHEHLGRSPSLFVNAATWGAAPHRQARLHAQRSRACRARSRASSARAASR